MFNWLNKVLNPPTPVVIQEPTSVKEEVKEDCYNPLLEDGAFKPNVTDNFETTTTFTEVDKVVINRSYESGWKWRVLYTTPSTPDLWLILYNDSILTSDDLKYVPYPNCKDPNCKDPNCSSKLEDMEHKICVIAANKLIRDGGYTITNRAPKVIQVAKS